MATYRYEAAMKFGKYYGVLTEADKPRVDPATTAPFESAQALSDALENALEASSVVEGEDEVIFRGTAYTDFNMLTFDVKVARY